MDNKSTHHRPTDPKANNPNSHRFNGVPPKRSDGFDRVAFVLQGGGSLGAYQMGVIKALLEAGYHPDWISATSIGSVQGAIIVGNPPEDRIAKLEEFWHRISTYSPFDYLGHAPGTLDLYNHLSSNASLLFGQKGFFRPRWNSPYMQFSGRPDTLSFYDTSPLKQTLLELLDFERLNNSMTRLSLGAVAVSTGDLVYFNNINYLITPEHVMGSGALPPGFPAVKVDKEYYWDGGIHSNTPLEVILDAKPAAHTLCFVIDCFGGKPFVPTDLDGVTERTKDIGYSTHARRAIKHYVEKQNLQFKLKKLSNQLSADQQPLIADLMAGEEPQHYTLVHIAYSARIHRGASKDYNFGQVTLQKRIASGYFDAQALLAEADQWDRATEDLQCRFYEAPNNLSRLTRKGDF